MIEATIGVVSAGLFLNAITYQRVKKTWAIWWTPMKQEKKSLMPLRACTVTDSLITLNMNTYLNRVN